MLAFKTKVFLRRYLHTSGADVLYGLDIFQNTTAEYLAEYLVFLCKVRLSLMLHHSKIRKNRPLNKLKDKTVC